MEIERKWLIDVNNIPYNLDDMEKVMIEQIYVCFEPEIRVRRFIGEERYIMTIKTGLTQDGLKRDEYEINITKDGYETLITKSEGNIILKDRYKFKAGENTVEIDVFKGNLLGLAYIEIEFESEERAKEFKTPEWVDKDVTGDIRYKNGYLARFGTPKN